MKNERVGGSLGARFTFVSAGSRAFLPSHCLLSPLRRSRSKSGVAAACLALELGARVIGADANPRAGRLERNADAKASAAAARAGVLVRTDLGAHETHAASFAEADVIVLSPGVPLKQPQVAAALARGEQEVLSELAFAARSVAATERDFFARAKGAAPTKKLAVTGTNGKSTTCAFAAQLVRACGKRAFLGGNAGTPLSLCALEFLRAASNDADAPPYDALVVEVSSYQLEHPGWRSLRFDAACVTTLSPDHLERHGDMATYAAVKARVFAALRGAKKLAVVPVAEDVAFETEDGEDDIVAIARRGAVVDAMTSDAPDGATETFEHVGGEVARVGDLPGVVVDHGASRATIRLPFAESETMELSALRAAGAHNATNAGVAALLVRALDADAFPIEALEAGVGVLDPPPHRMQRVDLSAGAGGDVESSIEWIDDSKATNVESARAGLAGYARGGKAVVLLGGQAKGGMDGPRGIGFGVLADALANHAGYIAFGASGKDIAEELSAAGAAPPLAVAATMRDAVAAAKKNVEEGGAVVLSPGCASFDEFDNFEHRGRVFAALARGERVYLRKKV